MKIKNPIEIKIYGVYWQIKLNRIFLTNDEDITNSGSEGVSLGILDVDNVKTTGMSLTGHDGSNSASVSSSGDHAKVSGVELDGIEDLASGDVDLDGVVHLDDGVGVPDGSAVTGVQIWDTIGASLGLPDLAQLVHGLLGGDSVNGESSLDIIDDTEVLSGLLDLDNIHKSSWEPMKLKN